MQQREKVLLIALLGALGFWVVLPTLEGVLLGPFQSRITRRDELREAVADKTKQADDLEAMERQLMLWSIDSLPPDPLNAQRVYSEWLVDLARMSGFRNIEPQLGNRSPSAQVYTSIPVTLAAEATLKDLATFLFHFERTGLLQRIIKCDIVSPETDGNPLLSVTLTADGIALRDAPQRSRIFPRTVLKQPIQPGSTVMEVEQTSSFPPDETLRVRLGHEFLTVTKRASGTWTVRRAVDSTTAVEHAAGAIVEYAPLKRTLDPDLPQTIAEYERLLTSGPFVKPRPPFVYRPQLAPLANQTLLKGTPLSLQAKLSGWDPANGPPVYELDEFSPASMQIDADGKISWNPAVTTELGDYPVGVVVTSKTNPDVSLTATFNVTLRDPNLPPSVRLLPTAPIAWIGRLWTVTATGSDPEQPDQLTFSLAGTPPEGLTIDSSTGVLRWDVPETIEPGTIPVTVQVADRGDPPLSATAVVNVTVEDDNAQFTYLAGCLGQAGDWTAWLYDRSTNKSHYVKVGEQFQVSDISGKVVEITLTSMAFEDARGRWKFLPERPLREAELVSAATPAADADSTEGTAVPKESVPASDTVPDAETVPPNGGDTAPPAAEVPSVPSETVPSDTAPEPANEPAADR